MPDRLSAKQPAVLADRLSARQPAVLPDARSAKQPAMPRGTGRQAAVMPDRSSAKHPAAGYPGQSYPGQSYPGGYRGESAYSPSFGAVAGTAAVAAAPRAGYDVAAAPTRMAAAVAVAEPVSAPKAQTLPGAWIRLGTTPLSGFGKWMLALAGVEVFLGAAVLAAGILTLVNQGRPFPVSQFALGWAIAVVLLSVLGGQIVNRPIYRRGMASKWRRGFQGAGLVLYTLAVHAVAVWGAVVFAGAQANPVLAVAAFLLFGVNVLVVGGLSVANILG